MLLTLHFFNKF